MGRKYTAFFEGVAVTAQQDFFEILAPSDAVIVLHDIDLSQTTEFGDAAEEQLLIRMVRGVGAVTSGNGTSATVNPIEDGDTATGATVEKNGTTKMVVGSGTLEQLAAWAWNVRIPFVKIFTPETRPVISPGNRLTIELATTPADSITMNGTITFEEIGG